MCGVERFRGKLSSVQAEEVKKKQSPFVERKNQIKGEWANETPNSVDQKLKRGNSLRTFQYFWDQKRQKGEDWCVEKYTDETRPWNCDGCKKKPLVLYPDPKPEDLKKLSDDYELDRIISVKLVDIIWDEHPDLQNNLLLIDLKHSLVCENFQFLCKDCHYRKTQAEKDLEKKGELISILESLDESKLVIWISEYNAFLKNKPIDRN